MSVKDSVKVAARRSAIWLANRVERDRLRRAALPGGPTSPSRSASLLDIEAHARRLMDPVAWSGFALGAGDGLTIDWNRQAFDRLALCPRFLGDLSAIDTEVDLFGEKMPSPLILAPTGFQRAMHPNGETETVIGAGRQGVTAVISSVSTTPFPALAAQATAPLWFQMYIGKDRGVTAATVELVAQAGCKALCVTVDSPSFGARDKIVPMDRSPWSLVRRCQVTATRHRMSLPTPHGQGASDAIRTGWEVTWADIDWLRSITRLPIILKGVLHPQDAVAAHDHGVDGVIVSNHGGRNLDTSLATIDALGPVADAIGGKMAVMMDGGVRRGTDVLKALALGAKAVLIGRPYVYGLFLNGHAGVSRVIEILNREFIMAMLLAGETSANAVSREILRPLSAPVSPPGAGGRA